MKVIGEGKCHLYEHEDDRLHTADSERNWQESFVNYFWDVERQVYGFIRLSQQPNQSPSETVHWIHVWTPRHVYRHVATIPLAAGAISETSLEADGGRCRYAFDGRFHWTIKDEETGFELELTIDQIHPGIGPFVADDADYLVSQTNQHHIEASGLITGRLRSPDEDIALNGIAWRDHSWGKRDWNVVRAHRFFPALFGPDFGIFCLTFVGADGTAFKAASIIRGDTVEMTTDFDILARIGSDALSNAGGTVRLRLEGVDTRIEFEPVTTCSLSFIQQFTLSSTMCRVTMGDKVGVGVAETSSNPLGGTDVNIYVAPSSESANGLFPRRSHPWQAN